MKRITVLIPNLGLAACCFKANTRETGTDVKENWFIQMLAA